MMKKLVNGNLVDLTPEEASKRQSEVVEQIAKRVESYITEYRREQENGGLTLSSGMTVQTDPISRANLLGAKELGTSIDWKTESGFVTVTATQMAAIANAVGEHIQKCFSAEKTLLETHAQTPYKSIQAVKQAFDREYDRA